MVELIAFNRIPHYKVIGKFVPVIAYRVTRTSSVLFYLMKLKILLDVVRHSNNGYTWRNIKNCH